MNTSQKAHRFTSTLLVFALVMLAVVGCTTAGGVVTSANIIDLDKELKELLGKKPPPTERNDPDIDSRLGGLAIQAGKEGAAASKDNPPSAVSLYRIAAIAAWAAGPPHNARVPGFSEKGAAACERLPGGGAPKPSDCDVLRMASNLALLDKKVDEVEKMRDAGPSIPQGSLEKAVTLIEAVSGQIQKVMEARPADGQEAESLTRYLKANLNSRFCTADGLTGRVLKGAPTERMQDRMRTAVNAAEESLQAKGFPTTCH